MNVPTTYKFFEKKKKNPYIKPLIQQNWTQNMKQHFFPCFKIDCSISTFNLLAMHHCQPLNTFLFKHLNQKILLEKFETIVVITLLYSKCANTFIQVIANRLEPNDTHLN